MSRSHLLADELSRFLGRFDPVRQMRREIGKQWRFSWEIRPSPPIVLVGGEGRQCAIVLDIRAFLALRQMPALAESPYSGYRAVLRYRSPRSGRMATMSLPALSRR